MDNDIDMKSLFPATFLILLFSAHSASTQLDSPWVKVTSEDKSFSIEFPTAPEKQITKLKTGPATIEVISYALKPEGKRPAFFLSYSESPGGANKLPPQKRLDHARDAALASTKGKLLSEKKMVLQGHPGRELVIETKENQQLRTRIFVVKNRLYQLFIVGTPEQTAAKDAHKFLDSFELKSP